MNDACRQIELQNDLQELKRLGSWLAEWAKLASIDSKTLFQLNLVCDELVTNAIVHGSQQEAEHAITISLRLAPDEIELIITDDGVAFNPLALSAPDVTLPLEERKIGGLGIHFVREVMDEVAYKRVDSLNIIFMKKYRPQEPCGGLRPYDSN